MGRAVGLAVNSTADLAVSPTVAPSAAGGNPAAFRGQTYGTVG